MTEKQIYNKLDRCWEWNFSQYTNEAEWYPDTEKHVWVCDIPSIMKSVRLTLNLDTAAIHIEGRVIVERSTVNSKYGEWKTIQEEWF